MPTLSFNSQIIDTRNFPELSGSRKYQATKKKKYSVRDPKACITGGIREQAAHLDLEALLYSTTSGTLTFGVIGLHPLLIMAPLPTLHMRLMCISWLHVTTSLADPVPRPTNIGKQSLERHRTAQWT